MTHLVWLVNNVTHYHKARADAFARSWDGRLTLLALSDRDELSALEAGGCSFAEVATLFPSCSLGRIRKGLLRKKLLGSLAELKPDVCCLNGWGLPGTAVMLEWALRSSVPCVLFSDSNQHDRPARFLKEELKRRFVSQCSSALVAGRSSRAYVMQLGIEQQYIFDGYDVVDNEYFSSRAEEARSNPMRWRKDLELPEKYFLACARFEPKKNLRRLIEAFARYTKQVVSNPWKLVIVGDGTLRPELLSFSTSLGIDAHISFRGLEDYRTLPYIYGLAKTFVHASTTEQWGLVVNESMAAGLPVLVSEACGCAPELVNDTQNGYTFNPLNLDELAQRMLSNHKNEDQLHSMGQMSLEIIAEWGLERFSQNLRRAIVCAQSREPRRSRLISKAAIRIMAAAL